MPVFVKVSSLPPPMPLLRLAVLVLPGSIFLLPDCIRAGQVQVAIYGTPHPQALLTINVVA